MHEWNPKVWVPLKWKLQSCTSAAAVYYAAQGGSNFFVCGRNPEDRPFKGKLLSNTFLLSLLFIMLCTVVPTFEHHCRLNPNVWWFKWEELSPVHFAQFQLFPRGIFAKQLSDFLFWFLVSYRCIAVVTGTAARLNDEFNRWLIWNNLIFISFWILLNLNFPAEFSGHGKL